MIRAAAAVLLAAVLVPAGASARQRGHLGGVVPDIPTGAKWNPAPRAHAANLPYGGGPVLHWNRTHLIFWQPSGSGLGFDPGYQSLMERFLVDVAHDSRLPLNVYGLSGQYTDNGGPAAYDSTYGGAIVATDPLPPNGCAEPLLTGPGWLDCMSDQQLQAELTRVVSVERLPQTGNDVYFLVLPQGLGSCEFSGPDSCALGGTAPGSYCGYHSFTPTGLLYAVIPYNAVPGHCQSDNPRPNGSTADPAISTISHEHNETVTDPLDNGWVQAGPTLQEDGDLCISDFGPTLGGSATAAWNQVINNDHYYLQNEWSNDSSSCQPRDEWDSVAFKAPSRGRAKDRLRFVATAHDPDGAIVDFDWFFGDHRTGGGRHVRHRFRHAGVYRVVLRTTDSGGNYAFLSELLKIRRALTVHSSTIGGG